MHLLSVSITNFRNITEAHLEFDPDGTTVLTGNNGMGKTSVIEAIGYLATLQSFRGAPKDALVRNGSPSAIVRAVVNTEGRHITIEAEIGAQGRSRTLVNRQPVKRRSELHGVLRASVFTPEYVGVIREGPSWRRSFLDNTLEVLDTRNEAVIVEVDRVLRQRAALLRNGGRRPSPEVLTTLDVWDDRLARSGSALVEAREALVAELQPLIQKHHDALAGASVPVTVTYGRSWEDDLASALVSARDHDLQRGITSVGPHRDELTITLDGLPSRTHASQGEQRSLALALQLAAHDLATARLGSAPLLLLDDVFSELDPERTRALLAGMPPGQTLLTTALPPPPEVEAARIYRISLDGWTMENPGGDGHGVAV